MKLRALAAALAATLTLAPLPAGAWETSTHTGLAEQAALAAQLDAQLRALGFSGGLFEALTIPPADARELLSALARHAPSGGYTPDARGRQYALGWLMAGAALAESTPTWAANHFFDPTTGAGWRAPAEGFVGGLVGRTRGAIAPPARGVPAPDWITSKDNPLGLQGFLDQYEKSLRAATPGERGRHLAGALVAAGAMLHVLADMASPSHVRGDEAAHDAQVGADETDRGARLERLAAIAWGRLGVPRPERPTGAPTLRGFFGGAGATDGAGLATWTASRFFSPGTLPRSVDVGTTRREDLAGVLARALTRPAPTVPRRLNLMSASQPEGATLRDAGGVCLARYRVEHGRLSWWLDDECLVEQAAALLPVAAAYDAGLLRWLFRGDLRLSADGGPVAVTVHGTALGKGTLTLLGEDGRGVRTVLSTTEIAGGADAAVIASAPAPAGARRIIASFRGVDAAGEPVVAAGLLDVGP